MLSETFVPMGSHNDRFAIYDLGRIFDTVNNKFVPWQIHKSRANLYLRVTLPGNKKHMVHNLVAFYHLPLPDNDTLIKVDHLDNNTLNPAANNLAWISDSDNIKKSHDSGTILIEGRIWKSQRYTKKKKKGSIRAVSAVKNTKHDRQRPTLLVKQEDASVGFATMPEGSNNIMQLKKREHF